MIKSLDAKFLESKIATAKSRSKNAVTSIRAKCTDCQPESSAVKNCGMPTCPLHPYRFGKNPFRGKTKPENYQPPLKAIRAECLSCNYTSKEIDLCPCTGCAIHPYRYGVNPFISEAKRTQGQKSACNFKKQPQDRGNQAELEEVTPQ